MIITWDYDPLFAAVFDSNQSLRGYYLHRPHLACAVSSKKYTLLQREEEGKALKVQRPVYYLSEVLTPSKQRYPHYQKLVYGIYCWKYALEAIIKALLLYLLVHDNCLYSCYNCVIRKS